MNLKTLAAALLLAACAVPAVTAVVDVAVDTKDAECLAQGVGPTPTTPTVYSVGCTLYVHDGPEPYEAYCGPLGEHDVQPTVSTSGCRVSVRA